jgi:hypothetical protein
MGVPLLRVALDVLCSPAPHSRRRGPFGVATGAIVERIKALKTTHSLEAAPEHTAPRVPSCQLPLF